MAPCCGGRYWCRHCHNEEHDSKATDTKLAHVLDRFAVQEVRGIAMGGLLVGVRLLWLQPQVREVRAEGWMGGGRIETPMQEDCRQQYVWLWTMASLGGVVVVLLLLLLVLALMRRVTKEGGLRRMMGVWWRSVRW